MCPFLCFPFMCPFVNVMKLLPCETSISLFLRIASPAVILLNKSTIVQFLVLLTNFFVCIFIPYPICAATAYRKNSYMYCHSLYGVGGSVCSDITKYNHHFWIVWADFSLIYFIRLIVSSNELLFHVPVWGLKNHMLQVQLGLMVLQKNRVWIH